MARSGTRLISVVGPGGVGKTRLALEVGQRQAADLSPGGFDAIIACDLVEARTPVEICAAMAQVLEVPVTSPSEAEAVRAIGAALGVCGRALVVLDNFEQLVESSALVPLRWLEQAPQLCLVITSRERLAVEGEHVFELSPLPVDGEGLSEAATLFALRVAAVKPELEDGPLAPVAREIAQRLEGLPLAIELAAARATMLSPKQILDRLDNALTLLSGRRRDVRPKQATMRDAITWSWDLLDDEERRALARCSVFHGGFSLEAAEAVLDHGARTTVLDVLEELTERSLLRAHAAPGFPDEVRFSMFVAIREFAAEQLRELGLHESAVAARDAYFLAVGSEWALHAREHGGNDRLKRLSLEQENLLAVARDALSEESDAAAADRALRALLALEPIMVRRSVARFDGLLEAALGYAARADLSPGGRVFQRARLVFATNLRFAGQRERALEIGRDVEAVAASIGEAALEAEALLHLGDTKGQMARYGEAEDLLRRAVTLAEDRGISELEVRARASRGGALMGLKRFDAAADELSRARVRALRAGDVATAGLVSRSLGHLHSERGQMPEAHGHLEEALALAREQGDKYLESLCISDLALVLAQEGRYEDAAAYYHRALGLHREIGNRRFEAFMLAYRGLMFHWLERHAEAEEQMEGAIPVLRAINDDRTRAFVLGRLGALAADAGAIERAKERLTQSRILTEAEGDRDRLTLLAIHEGHLEVALARAAVARDDLAAAHAHKSEAERRLERTVAPAEGEPIVGRSDDARLAVGLLRRALERLVVPAIGLVVSEDCAHFRTPGGHRGDLVRRQTLLRLFEALVRARRDAPGTAVSADTMLQVGWPGDRSAIRVAKNRLYVAIATLRGHGLREVIQGAGDGWRLDPDVPLFIVRRGDV